MISRFNTIVTRFADKANWVAGASIVAMMLVTVTDVTLRFFRCPVPGTYDVVGLLGALTISLSLGYTSVQKGHIAVDFLVSRFSKTTRNRIQAVNSLIATVFFAAVAWESMVYAFSLRASGEVSPTLKLPTYPFVVGVAAGCVLLCCVLLVECGRSLAGEGAE